MSKQVTDISQIRKYLNGELDAKAMHRLEKRAQHDPFLMDALEGYQKAQNDQQPNLAELTGRLNQRVSKEKRIVIPFRTIGIAASVLIICSAGVWWFYQGHPRASIPGQHKATGIVKAKTTGTTPEKSRMQTALAMPAAKVAQQTRQKGRPSETRPASAAQPALLAAANGKQAAQAMAPAPIKDSLAHDTTPVNEMIVMGYTTQKKKDTASPGLALAENKVKTADKKPLQEVLIAKAAGVQIHNNSTKLADYNKLAAQGNGAIVLNQLLRNQELAGRVISKDDGLPVPGASVKVAGTNKVTTTDAEGRFRIKTDSLRNKLIITEIGYQSRQVSANNRDSVKNIILEPNSRDLAEVVVTGYNSQAKDAGETAGSNAHPQKGWGSYRKYLRTNAASPDGNTGVVKLSFTVDKYGNISNITVVKGLSDAINKKAVSLVAGGPAWVGNSNKKPEKVSLRIKFVK